MHATRRSYAPTCALGAILILALIIANSARTASVETIDVTATIQHQNTAHLPPKGRAGDALSSIWVVRDRFGRAIGETILDCRWVTATLRLCLGQANLPLGSIIMAGATRTTILGQFVVIGGTGHYSGANGDLVFKKIGIAKYAVSVVFTRKG